VSLDRCQSCPARTSGISYSRTIRFGRTLGFALSPGVCYRSSTPIECAGAVLHPRRNILRRVTLFWCAGPAPLACVLCGATNLAISIRKACAVFVVQAAGKSRSPVWPVTGSMACPLVSGTWHISVAGYFFGAPSVYSAALSLRRTAH
jgi:hypothetical protein